MRAGLVEWSTFIGKIETAILLERQLGVRINDTDLDALETGMDFISLIGAKTSSPDVSKVPEAVRAAITATRGAEISLEELRMPLNKLLADLRCEG
jgi:hypothetical protein